ncbi:hypothetical protein ACO22_02258 [Paracoccidioides brasiliensis]|uniref:Uncharacterized protein n=1 Tax=Paracoccidioides brasiliensis TaxID=121759 RepID=A0A1D2JJM3_PARBR|nr:hypothetical protein ACO22_02258 [Paracoccidioides brasiliensis]
MSCVEPAVCHSACCGNAAERADAIQKALLGQNRVKILVYEETTGEFRETTPSFSSPQKTQLAGSANIGRKREIKVNHNRGQHFPNIWIQSLGEAFLGIPRKVRRGPCAPHAASMQPLQRVGTRSSGLPDYHQSSRDEDFASADTI